MIFYYILLYSFHKTFTTKSLEVNFSSHFILHIIIIKQNRYIPKISFSKNMLINIILHNYRALYL